MCLDYSEKSKLKISMKEYIDKIIDEFPKVIDQTASTPAADYLFQIRDDTEASKLNEGRAIHFHHSIAQLLFLSGQARQDIETAVAF